MASKRVGHTVKQPLEACEVIGLKGFGGEYRENSLCDAVVVEASVFQRRNALRIQPLFDALHYARMSAKRCDRQQRTLEFLCIFAL